MLPENAERRRTEGVVQTSARFRYAILHPPRRLWVTCSYCGYSALNELNMLRRSGWQETADTPRSYRCGDCAAVAL